MKERSFGTSLRSMWRLPLVGVAPVWVGEFSTAAMRNFRPELTKRNISLTGFGQSVSSLDEPHNNLRCWIVGPEGVPTTPKQSCVKTTSNSTRTPTENSHSDVM